MLLLCQGKWNAVGGIGRNVLLHLRFAISRFVDGAILGTQLARQLFLAWKVRQVFGGKHLVVVFGQRVLDNRVAFVRAEHDAYRRIVAFVHELTRVVVHIHLHLAQVLMRKVIGLKVDEHEAAH